MQANTVAKEAVATTKALAMNELYEELETPEGERKIFRIAKARDKTTKDFSHMKQIKNEHGVVLRDLDMIIGRWKGYFDKLPNEENPRSIFDDGVPNEGLTQVVCFFPRKPICCTDVCGDGSGGCFSAAAGQPHHNITL